MRQLIFPVLILGSLFLTACVSTDYVGQSYTPTNNVDVFYSMNDIDRPHSVMGKITANAMDGWDSDAMVEELKSQAMARGADALVIEGVHTESVGSYTTTYGDNDPEWVVSEDGELKYVGNRNSSSSSVTTDTREKVMDAELVKYD